MANHARRPSRAWNWNLKPLDRTSSRTDEQPETSTSFTASPQAIERNIAGWLKPREREPLQLDAPEETGKPLLVFSKATRTRSEGSHGHRATRSLKGDGEDDRTTQAGQTGLGGSADVRSGTVTTLSSLALMDPSLTFRLHSDPTATRIIYLDFDGHTTTGTAWNTNSGVASYSSPAYDTDGSPGSFSSTELNQIQQIWQRVAADFAPFAVDVTTQAPPLDWLSRTSSDDSTYGIRVVISGDGPYYGSGGVSYVNSFTWDTDTPAFIYKKSPINVSETISHEVGHTLGLSHDGTTGISYYSGHGSGEEGWAPIMGASTSQNVTTWDDGTYTGSNNGGSDANGGKGPDDLYVITNYNGFSYQPDTEGESILNAVPLSISNGSFGRFGTITTRYDQDFFSFNLTSAGTISLSADPYWSRTMVDGDGLWGGVATEQLGPISDLDASTPWIDHGSNLDLSMQLLTASGNVIATSNPAGLRATFDGLALGAGTYVVKLDGVGTGNPTAVIPTGYSDYASIGNYWLSGTLSGAVEPPAPLLPTLSAGDASVAEGSSSTNTSFKLSVNLGALASTDVILSYSTRDGSATSKGKSSDFMAISNGQLVIPKGQLSGTISIQISADLRSEANETFNVDFKAVSGALLDRSSTQITILNDDIITGSGSKMTMLRAMGGTRQGSLNSTDGSSSLDPVTGMQTVMRTLAAQPETTAQIGMADNRAMPMPPTHFLPEPFEALTEWAHDNASVVNSDPLQHLEAAQGSWLMDNNPGL